MKAALICLLLCSCAYRFDPLRQDYTREREVNYTLTRCNVTLRGDQVVIVLTDSWGHLLFTAQTDTARARFWLKPIQTIDK